jgi:hypothetical protein
MRKFAAVGAVATALTGLSSSALADTFVSGFDTGLPAGWVTTNNSNPAGSKGWFHANAFPSEAVFPAHLGPTNSYAAVNFTATTGGTGTINAWLVSQQFTWAAGDLVRFYTRTVSDPTSIFPDRLEVRASTAGASTNVGSTSTDVGDFTTTLVSINPTLQPSGTASGYPTAWTAYFARMPSAGTGRIAFRYQLPNGGPLGANGDAIGVDTFSLLPYVKGDMNGDGVLNNLDIAPFVQALTNPAGFQTSYPNITPSVAGDCNNDSVLNNLDIAGFVSSLTGGAGSAPLLASIQALVPEPSSASVLLLGAAGLVRRRRR